jgi:hypothetical protein
LPSTIKTQALFAALLAFGVTGRTWAQDSDSEQTADHASGKSTVSTPSTVSDKPATSHKDDDTIDYEKFVKGLKKADGPMALYQKGKNIYLELPEAQIGRIFLIQAAFASGLDAGFMHAGMPIGGKAVDAFKFERKDDSVWLVRPNISNRWSADTTFKVGAERTFPDAKLSTFRVEQHNTEKKLLLVNITPLFLGDLFHVGEIIAGTLGGPYQLDGARSEPEEVQGFPENSVVEMRLHYSSARGAEPNPLQALFGGGGNTLEDDRSAPVKIVYTMWWRKDSNYVPRIADSRIGYFTTDFFSVDRLLQPDKDQHFINRFDLEKKDPKAAVSEPVKPIVWTIDPSIPDKYHQAIKDGILRWNKAFEDVGFKNAIQVQEVPKDDKDYNHADGRYNVIRMMVGPEAPFAAISLLRTDPISGQILNASITLDANVLSSLIQEHARTLPVSLEHGQSRAEQVLLRAPSRDETDDKFLFETKQDEAQKRAAQKMRQFGWDTEMCTFASDMADETSMSYDAMRMAPGGSAISQDEYIKAYLSEMVCHEVGHCLGLRHNFAGSTLLSTKELGDEKVVAQMGTSASVMDYTPPNAPAVLKGRGTVFMNQVGVYDKWAIDYGYAQTGAKAPQEEVFKLSQIASKSGLQGHQYLTDEDADQSNPNGVRFDCSSDPLNFSAKQLEELHRARQYAIVDLPKPGESYTERTRVILGTIRASFNEGRIAARFVGGTLGTRNFRGDAHELPTVAPVPSATQRQAMNLIVDNFFAKDSFNLPTSVMENLSLDSDLIGEEWNAPVREIVGGMEQNLLALVMSATTTDRIAENSYKVHDQHAYSLDEHYDLLLHSICSELWSGQDISPLRRDLQRFYVQGLILQAGAPQGSVSDDVRLVAEDALRRLNNSLDSAPPKFDSRDNLTKLHIRDLHDQITRFLARRESEAR